MSRTWTDTLPSEGADQLPPTEPWHPATYVALAALIVGGAAILGAVAPDGCPPPAPAGEVQHG